MPPKHPIATEMEDPSPDDCFTASFHSLNHLGVRTAHTSLLECTPMGPILLTTCPKQFPLPDTPELLNSVVMTLIDNLYTESPPDHFNRIYYGSLVTLLDRTLSTLVETHGTVAFDRTCLNIKDLLDLQPKTTRNQEIQRLLVDQPRFFSMLAKQNSLERFYELVFNTDVTSL